MPSFLYMGIDGSRRNESLLNETVITLGESRMEIRLSSDSDIYRCFRVLFCGMNYFMCWKNKGRRFIRVVYRPDAAFGAF